MPTRSETYRVLIASPSDLAEERQTASEAIYEWNAQHVTETEIGRVVDFWKQQADPEYEQSFLIAPPNEEEAGEGEAPEAEQDPVEDVVRLVLQMRKASTSTLQRHLRLGYGRAA